MRVRRVASVAEQTAGLGEFAAIVVDGNPMLRGECHQPVAPGHALGRQHVEQEADTRHVAALPVDAGDDTELDWIAAHHEHDRNTRSRL